ncbi:MAG: transposase [Fimbriimonadaceae bacterium]|nr:transposase [Fimbriimonadaceae bacterium]
MSVEKPGWYSRGYLPHFDASNKVQFITFHLADSLPASAIQRIGDEIQLLPKESQEVERRRKLEKWLDQGLGACWLGRPEIARLVDERLQSYDGDRYLLLGWCIMPNHVHVLAEFSDEDLVWKVVKGWKGATAIEANKKLGRSGPFWFREYWDRYIRDETHLRNTLRYIDQNPVKAKLCREPIEWEFGSARLFGSG